jgi:hypothetical protein
MPDDQMLIATDRELVLGFRPRAEMESRANSRTGVPEYRVAFAPVPGKYLGKIGWATTEALAWRSACPDGAADQTCVKSVGCHPPAVLLRSSVVSRNRLTTADPSPGACPHRSRTIRCLTTAGTIPQAPTRVPNSRRVPGTST